MSSNENQKQEVTKTPRNMTPTAAPSVEETPTVPEKITTKNTESNTHVYLGPSVPQYRLLKGQIFKGTRADVEKHLEEAIKLAPQIKHLIVEPSEAAEAMEKIRDISTGLYQQYKEVGSILKKEKEGDLNG